MKSKVLRRDISYNVACSILEVNHYNIAETKTCGIYWTIFIDKSGKMIARYNEKYGRLEVICD